MKASLFRNMLRKGWLGMATVVLAAGLAAGTATAASASTIPQSGNSVPDVQTVKTEAAETGAVVAQACAENPDPGWVLFYEHRDCGGRYQGWTRCGFHDIADAMHRKTSSYWDRQTDGAYTWAWEYDGFDPIFETRPNTGVRNVATWENDKAEWAELICP